MFSGNKERANHNKRLLESPSESSKSKRTMSENPSAITGTSEEKDTPLTTNSFRLILVRELNATLDEKLSKLATKEDIEVVTQDVQQLQSSLQDHENRIQQMEWKQRSKNIIFKYVPQKKSYKAYITSLLHTVMGLPSIYPRSIFTLKLLTEKKQAIVLVEFSDNQEVREIFSNVNNLKGTNIILEKDLSAEERQRKGVLLNIRKQILKRAKENQVSIKIIVSENRIKFDNEDTFTFNKRSNQFEMMIGENGIDLREYLADRFKLVVDSNYLIDVNK